MIRTKAVRRPKHGATLSVELSFLIAILLTLLGLVVWWLWGILAEEEDRLDVLNRTSSGSMQEDCGGNQTVAVLQKAAKLQPYNGHNDPGLHWVWYQIDRKIDETEWSMDFNADGDTDDIIGRISAADPNHSSGRIPIARWKSRNPSFSGGAIFYIMLDTATGRLIGTGSDPDNSPTARVYPNSAVHMTGFLGNYTTTPNYVDSDDTQKQKYYSQIDIYNIQRDDFEWNANTPPNLPSTEIDVLHPKSPMPATGEWEDLSKASGIYWRDLQFNTSIVANRSRGCWNWDLPSRSSLCWYENGKVKLANLSAVQCNR